MPLVESCTLKWDDGWTRWFFFELCFLIPSFGLFSLHKETTLWHVFSCRNLFLATNSSYSGTKQIFHIISTILTPSSPATSTYSHTHPLWTGSLKKKLPLPSFFLSIPQPFSPFTLLTFMTIQHSTRFLLKLLTDIYLHTHILNLYLLPPLANKKIYFFSS